jgi:hypothetical protein
MFVQWMLLDSTTRPFRHKLIICWNCQTFWKMHACLSCPQQKINKNKNKIRTERSTNRFIIWYKSWIVKKVIIFHFQKITDKIHLFIYLFYLRTLSPSQPRYTSIPLLTRWLCWNRSNHIFGYSSGVTSKGGSWKALSHWDMERKKKKKGSSTTTT